MTQLHHLATHFARGLLSNFLNPPNRGRRECRVHAAPAVSCAIGEKRRTRAYRAAEASDIPCAMALRLISCSPRSGRACCHRRRRNCFHQLDASIGASGPHDFTVRISTVRQRHIRVHRIPSRVCDDRETPLVPGRDEIDILLIWRLSSSQFRKIRNTVGALARSHGIRTDLAKAGSTRLAQQA